MCDLSHSSAKTKIEGFKIVARKPKGKIYFSIAMGFKYPSDGHVPVVRKQRSIYYSEMAKDIISEDSNAYRKDMIGRTAVFIDFKNAHDHCYHWGNYVKKGYKLTVVLSEVSEDVMIGSYGDCKVAAGRRIRFIKEMGS